MVNIQRRIFSINSKASLLSKKGEKITIDQNKKGANFLYLSPIVKPNEIQNERYRVIHC